MKTWKKCTFIGILAIIVFAFIGCPNDTNDPCNCDPKAHLGIGENCKCGGKDCNNCTEQTATLDGISIKKRPGITVEQMNSAVNKISGVYNGNSLGNTDRNTFKAKVTEIQLALGNGTSIQGTVLTIGIDATATQIFDYFVDDIIYASVQLNQSKTIWLANFKIMIMNVIMNI